MDYLYILRNMDYYLCHVILTSLFTYGWTRFLLLTGILLNRSSTEVEKNCSPRIAIWRPIAWETIWPWTAFGAKQSISILFIKFCLLLVYSSRLITIKNRVGTKSDFHFISRLRQALSHKFTKYIFNVRNTYNEFVEWCF